nr:MAG TPA: hypothetical protein [Caudoviricetes sp.]
MRDKVEGHNRKCPSNKNVFEGQSRRTLSSLSLGTKRGTGTKSKDKFECVYRKCP